MSHKQVIIFLLLCHNKNISPWQNILNDVQNKIWCCTKNNFALKQKVWLCTKSNLVSTKTCWCCTKKYLNNVNKKSWCSTKKYFMLTKARWCSIKKIFCAQKSYFFFIRNGAPQINMLCKGITRISFSSWNES